MALLYVLVAFAPYALQAADLRAETREDGSVVEYEVKPSDEGDVLHGSWVRRYANGEVAEKGAYQDGLRAKRWRFYYENGEKREVGAYRDGKRSGAWDAYHENGQKRASGRYEKDLRSGKWRAWFDDGRLDDELTGVFRIVHGTYEDDAAFYEGSLLEERPHGTWSYYWPDGQPMLTASYFDGRRTGEWSFFHPNGILDTSFLTGDYSGLGWRRARETTPLSTAAFDPHDLPKVAEAFTGHKRPLDRAIDRLFELSKEEGEATRERLVARRRESFSLVLERLRVLDLSTNDGCSRATQLARLAELLLGGRSIDWAEGCDELALAGKQRAIVRIYALWLLTRDSDAFWEIVVPAYRPRRAADRNAQIVTAPIPTDELGLPKTPARYRARFDPDREPDETVQRGLAWLAAHQGPNGEWSADRFPDQCDPEQGEACKGTGLTFREAGMTGLALMAFLADGNTPFRGPYKHTVARAVRWLLASQDPKEGAWSGRDRAWIYQHAIGTQAMAEVQVLAPSVPVAESVEAAVSFCHRARNPKSAWRYHFPPDGENDTSVTAWMMLALLTAEDAGFDVDPAAISGTLSWLEEATDVDRGRIGYDGPGQLSARTHDNEDFPRNKAAEALTAAGLSIRLLISGGKDEGLTKMQAGLIRAQLPYWTSSGHTCDMYAWFWSSLACHLVGDPFAKAWRRALVKTLSANQRTGGGRTGGHAAGSWDPIGPWGYDGGRVYATLMCVLALQTPLRFGDVEEN